MHKTAVALAFLAKAIASPSQAPLFTSDVEQQQALWAQYKQDFAKVCGQRPFAEQKTPLRPFAEQKTPLT